MDASSEFDELQFGFEQSENSDGTNDVIVMRRNYRKQLTPDEANQLFLQWFEESFQPLIEERQNK